MMHPEPDYEAIFTKPTAPRSDWETFLWLFFEPSLLERFSKELSRKEAVVRSLRVYFKFIVPFVVLCWLLFFTSLVWSDVPERHPEFFNFDAEVWLSLNGFVEKWLFLMDNIAFGLVIGLAFSLVGVLITSIINGLTFGLVAGLGFGLGGCLALGFDVGLTRVLPLVFSIGLSLGTCKK